MTQLCEANLKSLPASVQAPGYDRTAVHPGILHVGTGNFHRAHQAVYTDDILGEDPRWGIIGASLQSKVARSRLQPQDYLYTLCEREDEGHSLRVIGSIQDMLTLQHQRPELIEAIARPEIKVITLTITEKGYCHTNEGRLDDSKPSVKQDLQQSYQPGTAPGVILAGLARRRNSGGGPISIISCDNLQGNGDVTRRVVLDFAEHLDPGLASWCRDQVTFPNSMVDRIVPRTTTDDIDRLATSGLDDQAPVICEPFRQWVIEDNFAAARPPWEAAGAELVRNVAGFEKAKLRLLNATHSALAYLGLLCGYDTIHEAMADKALAGFAHRLMTAEIAPLLTVPAELNLDTYIESILQRFANSAIAYRCAQVATDGSQKLPVRIFPSLQASLAAGRSPDGLAIVVAAWLQCLTSPRIAATFSDPVLANEDSLSATMTLPGRTDLLGELAVDDSAIQHIQRAWTQLQQGDPRRLLKPTTLW